MPVTKDQVSLRRTAAGNATPEGGKLTTDATIKDDGEGSGDPTKGNDGRQARRMRRRQLLFVFAIVASVIVLASVGNWWTLNPSSAWWTQAASSTEMDPIMIDSNRISRQHHERLRSRHGKHYESRIKEILAGHLTLLDIEIPSGALTGKNAVEQSDDANGSTVRYAGVTATFCHISWNLQREDPSQVPLFNDLRKKSPHCEKTTFSTDLWTVARLIEHYDSSDRTPGSHSVLRSQPPTAVIFHETRCGSTLMANMFAAFDPMRSRVYSEFDAPSTAITACSTKSDEECDVDVHRKLIQDVFMVMGRTPGKATPKHIFYKFQSQEIHSVSKFVDAMPTIPWIFLYRDSVEIIMSHLKNYMHGRPMPKDYRPNCIRNYPEPLEADQEGEENGEAEIPTQHPQLVRFVEDKDFDIGELTKEQYCAAHIAALAASALEQYQHEQKKQHHHPSRQHHHHHHHHYPPRWFVNYDELPSIAWETILPKLLQHPLSRDQKARLMETAHTYSKARGNENRQEWEEDSSTKRARAPETVVQAARLFLDPINEEIERVRLQVKSQ